MKQAVLGVSEQGRLGDVPLVGGKEEDVGTRAVHLVALARMNGLLLHRVDLQSVQLVVKHLLNEVTGNSSPYIGRDTATMM